MGGGVSSSGNPDERGALNLKIHPRGLITFDFIAVSIASIYKFSLKLLKLIIKELILRFHILFFFQTIGSPLLLL